MEGASNVTIGGGAQIINAAGPLRRKGNKKIVTSTPPKDTKAPGEIKVGSLKNATGVTITGTATLFENIIVGGGKVEPGQKLQVKLGEGAKDLKCDDEANVPLE